MNTSIRLAVTAVTASAAVALLLTGCSDNSNKSSSSSSSAQAATSSAAGSSAAPAPSAGGKSAASIDGKALEGNFQTNCAKQGGNLALALTDTGNATYGNLSVGATITGSDTVQAVAIAGSKGGANGQPLALGYGNGAPGGSAKLSKDGNTYHITGEGIGGIDAANPMAGVKTEKFDITFACSTIVGG
ncbi:hypothetical protein D5S18_11590 [Nocardia panacis]|uniref:Lipoprotein LpqH n=1 Tax=Nocardia panacis TaxID=2340916 RepID=A0A3A4KTS8_9NOCA|nr:lipoprotein LpqH [Nocardia panacis]RJO76856.1 hypothetical protein D5S18_11590 [Nocardia panacis]